MAVESKLQGKLTDTDLSMLLNLVHTSSKTGELKLRYFDTRYNTTYSFFRGRIGRVQTSIAAKISSIMQDYGVPQGVVEHLRAQKRSNTHSKLMITLSDGKKALSSEIIARALKRRVLMSLVALLLRTDGSFELILSERVKLTTRNGVNIDVVSLEASQKLDELVDYNEHVTKLGFDDVFKKNKHSDTADELNAYEKRLLSILNEPLSLFEALVKARLAWDELLVAVVDLQKKGIIKYLHNSGDANLKTFGRKMQLDEFATILDESIDNV